jgi:hypothetical protein
VFAGAAGRGPPASLTEQPDELCVIHHLALPLQKDMNAPIAEAWAFMSNRLHPLPNRDHRDAWDSYQTVVRPLVDPESNWVSLVAKLDRQINQPKIVLVHSYA